MVDASYRPFGLEPIEKASRDAITALQIERLKWSLQHAYENVAAYRKKFDAAGVHPGDLQNLEDLARFPFTTKQDLRENYPFGMFAVPQETIIRIHASSGTTGKPTVVGYTRRDLDTWSDLMARSIRASGGKPGMKVHVAYGYGLFTGGLGAHYGAERLGCTVIPVSGGMTERQVLLIQDLRPDVIMVTPSYMLAILDEFARLGIDPAASSLRVGLFGAEPWTEPMRRMARITGRSDDMIILRGVNLFPTQIEELILDVPELAPHFSVVLSRPARLDELTVRVEPRSGVDAAGRAPLAHALQDRIKNT